MQGATTQGTVILSIYEGKCIYLTIPKCDLTRPSCLCCIRSGRTCPGYRNDFETRFQTETVSSFATNMHKDRRRKRDIVPILDDNSEAAEETESLSTHSLTIERDPPYRLTVPRFNGAVEGAELLLLAPLTTIHIGRAAREYLSANLLRFILPSLGEEVSYVTHVPCRLGYEVALDHAVQCVVAAFHALNSQSSSKQKTLSLYMRALNSLQQAIDDPERSLSAETLCATELLCLFEVSTS
jgi:hypothetical protein